MAANKIAFRKKSRFVYLSLLMGAIFLFVDIMDLIGTSVYLRPRITPASWRSNIVMGHVVSLYFFLIGFIYSSEAGDLQMVKIAWASLVLNLTTFTIRTIYEIVYMDVHPMEF